MTFIWTFLFPEAGKYIPKLDETRQSRGNSILESEAAVPLTKTAYPFIPEMLKELHDEKVNEIVRPSRDRGQSELYIKEIELQFNMFAMDSKFEIAPSSTKDLPTSGLGLQQPTPRLGAEK